MIIHCQRQFEGEDCASLLSLGSVARQVLADSFTYIPLGNYNLPYEMLNDLTHGTALLWSYGLKFAAIPFVVLFLVTIGLGFMARVMPEMNHSGSSP